MIEFIKTKLIALLGLKHLYAEMQELKNTIDDVDYKVDEMKNDLENVEYRCDEVESETERLCSNLEDDLETKTEEALLDIQQAIESFNEMKEGYVLDVKITREVY